MAQKSKTASARVGKKGRATKAVVAKKAVVKAKAPKAKASAQIEKAKVALKQAVPSKPQAAAKPVKTAEPKAAKAPKARKIAVDIQPNEALSALTQKWANLYKKADQIEAKAYNMKAVFEEKTAITHKVLGWGYILANRNDRLEVLFKDGIRYLISNYKP